MKNYIFILLVFVLLVLSSCARISMAIFEDETIDKQVTIMENDSLGKEVVFLPIIHVGKERYYDSVKRQVDSLRNEGFIFYYEGLHVKDIDSMSLDTIERKFRKLLGIHLLGGGYTDEKNKSLPRLFRTGKYLPQNYDDLKIGSNYGDKLIDLDYTFLMTEYEKNMAVYQM